MVYADAYQACDDIEIVGLADPDKEHKRALVARAGIAKRVPEFDDWQEMLTANGDLDGVVICTPNFLHADQAVACLEFGVPITLDPPPRRRQRRTASESSTPS